MDADRRLAKALEAANDALQHLSMSPDFGSLDCTHIDRLLARVVDLPTEGNQRNSRRNLLVIRQWMITEGPGVVLLEVLGQLYWRLGELNGKQFEKFKASMQTQQSYLSLIQDNTAVTLVVQRIRHIQRSKSDACQDFLCELSDLTGLKVDSPMAEIERLRATSTSPFAALSVQSMDSTSSQETGYVSLIKYVPVSNPWSGDVEQLLLDFCKWFGTSPSSSTNVYRYQWFLSRTYSVDDCECISFLGVYSRDVSEYAVCASQFERFIYWRISLYGEGEIPSGRTLLLHTSDPGTGTTT
jgi:hypothetical protein